ncbi:LITAF domain-containing protein [Balamuthia mandrillaris]
MDYSQQPPQQDAQPLLYQQQQPPQQQGGYPPQAPPAGFYQGPPAAVTINKRFNELPEMHVCQWCGTQGVTNTENVPGLITYASAGVICLVGGWLGCFLIPFCIDSCQDVEHFCPSCRQLVGKYQRL